MKKIILFTVITISTVFASFNYTVYAQSTTEQKAYTTEDKSISYQKVASDDMGFVKVSGAKVWYRVNGVKHKNVKPTILVIHGGPGNSHDYLLPVLQLTDEYMVVFYDQLDSGRSEHPNNPALWTLDRFTEEIDKVRAQLGLEQVHLLASSWGGSIAINYAAQNPKGVKSIILSGPLINTKRWVSDNEKYRQQLPKVTLETLLTHEKIKDYTHPDYQQAVDYFYRRHLCRLAVWPDYVNYAMDNANGTLYENMWGPTEFLATGTLKNLDLMPKLSSIEIPTLFISGEFDEGTPAANEDYAAMMPNAETFTVLDASHMPHVEKPELFFKQVRQFLKRND